MSHFYYSHLKGESLSSKKKMKDELLLLVGKFNLSKAIFSPSKLSGGTFLPLSKLKCP
jgi:hypothetical protein